MYIASDQPCDAQWLRVTLLYLPFTDDVYCLDALGSCKLDDMLHSTQHSTGTTPQHSTKPFNSVNWHRTCGHSTAAMTVTVTRQESQAWGQTHYKGASTCNLLVAGTNAESAKGVCIAFVMWELL
jgi:hypothetical protein